MLEFSDLWSGQSQGTSMGHFNVQNTKPHTLGQDMLFCSHTCCPQLQKGKNKLELCDLQTRWDRLTFVYILTKHIASFDVSNIYAYFPSKS